MLDGVGDGLVGKGGDEVLKVEMFLRRSDENGEREDGRGKGKRSSWGRYWTMTLI